MASAQNLARRFQTENGATPATASVTQGNDPAPAVYLYPLQGRGVRALGIIQDYERVPPAWENRNVKTALYYHHGPLRWEERKATLTLKAPAHLYDMRTRSYLGHTAKAEFGLRPGEPELFALLPYRVAAVDVKRASSVQAGEALPVQIRIVTDGDAPAGDHVAHVRFLRQEGSDGPPGFAGDVLLKKGQGTLAVPTAFNDLPGNWHLQVTDALSGVRTQSEVKLTAAEDAGLSLGRRDVEVVREPLEWPQGEWVRYADQAQANLTNVGVKVGTIVRKPLNYGEFNGLECLHAKTLLELAGRKALYGLTYLACNDWKRMGWEDKRRVKALTLSGLGFNRPAPHLWYVNGYIDILFDDERITAFRIADVRKVDAGKDGRVDVTWESPVGDAVLSFALRLDGEALLQRLLVRPSVPVAFVKVRFRSYIGDFGNSKTRYVQTSAGRNAGVTDPKDISWAFYADEIEDLAYGKGKGAGGILIAPDDWSRVRYGTDGELAAKVDLQPGQTAALHWDLWLYADLTNEEALEAFTASRAREGEALKAFFAAGTEAP
jgi:hypothetical protein